MLSLSQARPLDYLPVAAPRLLCACIAFVGLPVVWPAAVTRWLLFGPAARPYWSALAAVLVAALVALMAYLRRIHPLRTRYRPWLFCATAAWCLAHTLGWSFQASNLSEPGVVLGYLLTTVWIAGALLMAAGLSSLNCARWLLVSSGSLAVGIAVIHSTELDGGGRAVVCWRLERIGNTAKVYAFCPTGRPVAGAKLAAFGEPCRIALPASDALVARPPGHRRSEAELRNRTDSRGFAPATKFKTAAVSAHTAANPADDFPAFRGQGGLGRIDGLELATDWCSAPPRPLWRQPIGSGWGGFAVVDGLAYTQEQRGEDECVVCYQALSGHERWLHADRVKFTNAAVGDGPRATPSTCNGRVYTLGATGLLNCLDTITGARLWAVDVLADNGAGNRLYGVSGSPLVLDGQVVVSVGGPGHSLVAYDAISGTRTWQAGDDAAGYGSPLACKFNGQEQIVVLNTPGVAAHDPKTGALLWSFPWTNDTQTNCSQPVPVGDDRLFVSTGYGKGCALLRTFRSAGGWSVDSLWTSRNLKTKFSSAVVNGGYAFGLDEGILTCIALADGSRRWKAGRYGHGQVLLVGDVLLVQCEDGQIVLVAADPTAHRELARYAALDGKTWNYPALAGRLLLLRNDQQAACFEVSMKQNSEEDPL